MYITCVCVHVYACVHEDYSFIMIHQLLPLSHWFINNVQQCLESSPGRFTVRSGGHCGPSSPRRTLFLSSVFFFICLCLLIVFSSIHHRSPRIFIFSNPISFFHPISVASIIPVPHTPHLSSQGHLDSYLSVSVSSCPSLLNILSLCVQSSHLQDVQLVSGWQRSCHVSLLCFLWVCFKISCVGSHEQSVSYLQ